MAVLLNNRRKTETFLSSNFIPKLKELTHAKFAVQLQLKSIKSKKHSLSNEKKINTFTKFRVKLNRKK